MMKFAPALLLAFGSLLPGCVLFPNYGGAPEKARGPELPPPLPEGLHDFKGVIHCHSHLSHDSRGTEEEIAAAANETGLDFLIMTDHYDRTSDPAVREAIRGFRGRTLFLPGTELRKDGGSLLVLGAERDFNPKASSAEIADEIHRQGGLVFVAHLEEFEGDLSAFPFDGLEIYNIHAATKQTNKIALVFRALFLPPSIVLPSLLKLWPDNFKRWDEWLERRPVPICAGNDAHNNVKLFGPLGGTVATYEQLFRTFTTHVWARSLDRDAILSALRDGRSYVSFDAYRDATGFWVEQIEGMNGPSWKVFVPEIATIRMIQAGKVVAETEGQWLECSISKPGLIYRVEVYLKGKPWILGGPFVAKGPR